MTRKRQKSKRGDSETSSEWQGKGKR